VIHYTAFIDESSAEGSIGSLVDTTYNEFKREHRHDLMGHKHRFVSVLKLYLLLNQTTVEATDSASLSSSL
jgi:hypothetical protein